MGRRRGNGRTLRADGGTECQLRKDLSSLPPAPHDDLFVVIFKLLLFVSDTATFGEGSAHGEVDWIVLGLSADRH